MGIPVNTNARVEEALLAETMKAKVMPEMLELLGKGKQVIVVLSGHFVKLQSVTEAGVVVQDPGGLARANRLAPWAEARNRGYFKGSVTFRKD